MLNVVEIRPVGPRVLPCGWTDRQTDKQKDMTQLVAAFRESANLPKNLSIYANCQYYCTRQRGSLYERKDLIYVIYFLNLTASSVCTGLFKMIVWVLTTCHTQYTSDSSVCIFFI
jgi:hypothetical protein